MTTMDGGMVTTNNKELVELAKPAIPAPTIATS